MSTPLYVKLEEYKDVENVLSEVRKSLNETKKEIEELKQMREKEQQFIDAWEEDAKKVEAQLNKINVLLLSEESEK